MPGQVKGNRGDERVEGELRAIRGQVEQARQLLADAIVKLGDSFSGLEKDTSAQKVIMESLLAQLSGGGDREGARDGQPGGRSVSIRKFAVETTSVLHQFTELLATVSGQSIKTVYRIDDMAEELDEVFKLVASINEIAEETFTLAVNATIEAAHAGQAGRSFSVIAGNVRELSKKTRRFNDQIGTQIGKAQTTVNEVRQIIAEMASRDLNVALAGKERVQSMLQDLERFETFVTESVDRANAAAGRISRSTSEAVTALQFEDIMSQLIAGIARRADRIGALVEGGQGEGDGRAAAGPAPPPVAEPVRQTNMHPGEVELF
jgi:methyl-accepting chemotaxis protein